MNEERCEHCDALLILVGIKHRCVPRPPRPPRPPASGQVIRFTGKPSNTGPVVVNGVKVVNPDGAPLKAGDIKTGEVITFNRSIGKAKAKTKRKTKAKPKKKAA